MSKNLNLDLKCGRFMARRSDVSRMNIVERTQFWNRLERIGIYPYGTPAPEPQIVEHIHRRSDMSPKEFALMEQLRHDVNGLKKQAHSHFGKKKDNEEKTYEEMYG